MSGNGIEVRMEILKDAVIQQMVKPLNRHGWETHISEENTEGEYIVVSATKLETTHKVALLYTSAISNKFYKDLSSKVGHIFTNGALYHIEDYAHGITVDISPISEFFPVLVSWNKGLSPEVTIKKTRPKTISTRRITSEKPIDGIWAILNQFASVRLAEKLVKRRATEQSIELTEAIIKTKSEGLAFTLRNAFDYLQNSNTENLNKRIISLYYGTLALAFAEMIAAPNGPTDLDEIQAITKQGHGLYTVQSSSFKDLYIGVLSSGFFPQWVSFLGYDTSTYPKSKAKAESDIEHLPIESFAKISQLLAQLPELHELFKEVFDEPPNWISILYDSKSNHPHFGSKVDNSSTYVNLFHYFDKIHQDLFVNHVWSITEIRNIETTDSYQMFSARVDHSDDEDWHEALPLHKSSFIRNNTLIFPVLGGVAEYRVIALIVLYALSILVRYMPSIWRRIEDGDLDQHLILIRTALNVFDRILPEEFLRSITNEKIHAVQPGSILG